MWRYASSHSCRPSAAAWPSNCPRSATAEADGGRGPFPTRHERALIDGLRHARSGGGESRVRRAESEPAKLFALSSRTTRRRHKTETPETTRATSRDASSPPATARLRAVKMRRETSRVSFLVSPFCVGAELFG